MLRRRTMGRSSSLKFRLGDDGVSRRLLTAKTPADEALILKSLRCNPNIQRVVPLQDEHIKQLTEFAWKEKVVAGQVLCNEGDLNSDCFYIVSRGRLEVRSHYPFDIMTIEDLSYLVRPKEIVISKEGVRERAFKVADETIRQLGARSSFGDSSMMYAAPRWTKCTALQDSEVWVISDASFRSCQQQALMASPAAKKQPEDVALITHTLAVNENLQRLTRFMPEHIAELVEVAWKEVVPKGVVFMREGDLNADACYIVAKGTLEFVGKEPFDVVQRDGASFLNRAAHTGAELSGFSRQTSSTTHIIGRGLMFGEISMLYCAPRFATVTALEECVIWGIDRSNFQLVQRQAGEDEMRERLKYLEHLAILDSFAAGGKQALAAVMEKMRLARGEVLSGEGRTGDTFYVLQSGSVQVSGTSKEPQHLTADEGSHVVHYFGESALESMPETETVQVASASATALVLKKKDFEAVWERLLEAAPPPAFQRYNTSVSKVGVAPDALVLTNLECVGLLGCSALGPVELRRHKVTQDLYVLKKLNKGLIVQKGFRSSVMRERTLRIGGVASPFVSEVHASFNTAQDLCILCEPVLGGELGSVFKRHHLYGSTEHVRFHIAGVIKGLEYLHEGRIVYRNLKPQNILLSDRGYPKLADMSLAKHLVGRTFTTCGTPGYMAPEILSGVGHGRAVDWWSLGVLIFELMCGYGPFDSKHPMEVFANVMFGIKRVSIPPVCNGAAADLIQALLQPADIDRLAMRQGGIQNVLDHAWFNEFDWGALKNRTLKAPYAPTWSVPPEAWKDTRNLSRVCLEHYSTKPDLLPRPIPYEDDHSGWDSAYQTMQ